MAWLRWCLSAVALTVGLMTWCAGAAGWFSELAAFGRGRRWRPARRAKNRPPSHPMTERPEAISATEVYPTRSAQFAPFEDRH